MSHGAGSDQADSTDSARREERRLSSLLRRLKKSKHSYEARRVADTTHGKMYRLDWECRIFLHAK